MGGRYRQCSLLPISAGRHNLPQLISAAQHLAMIYEGASFPQTMLFRLYISFHCSFSSFKKFTDMHADEFYIMWHLRYSSQTAHRSKTNKPANIKFCTATLVRIHNKGSNIFQPKTLAQIIIRLKKLLNAPHRLCWYRPASSSIQADTCLLNGISLYWRLAHWMKYNRLQLNLPRLKCSNNI